MAEEDRGGNVGEEEEEEELVREGEGDGLVGRWDKEESLSREVREVEGVQGPLSATGGIRSAEAVRQ